jgi:hypothetical protein
MKKPFKLEPTTGTIKDEKIIGRDKEIINILKSLKVQSITIEEIRRTGKTLLLRKLEYQCNQNLIPEFANDNFKAVYFQFQGKKNLGEVIDIIMRRLSEFKKWYQIDFNKTYDFMRSITGAIKVNTGDAELSVNLPEFKKDWKEIFFKCLEDIANTLEKENQKLILILDELPIMLWDWYKAGKQQEAIELLDILRERRQELEQKGLRFVYCGSIGIKVILQTFREEFDYTGEPTNDMVEYNLKPFTFEESLFLMECYILSGYKIDNNLKSKILENIHNLCNGLPFYLANIFIILQNEFDSEITEENVKKSYELILSEPKYQKAFNQLKERLDIYYPKKVKQMTKVLSIISKNKEEIGESEILSQMENDKEEVKGILYDLLEDHYLYRTIEKEERTYRFKYQIFKEWWKINIA